MPIGNNTGPMTQDNMVERVARALVEPLGYPKQAGDNWDGIWVGNQCDTPETGSLEYLCKSLARAAIATMHGSDSGVLREALVDLPRLIELQRTAAPDCDADIWWNKGLCCAAEMVRAALNLSSETGE